MSGRAFPARLSAFYGALFLAVGLQLPYLPVYYRSLGFSGREIAAVASVSPLAMLVVPPAWGLLADRTGRTSALLKLACAGAACFLLPLLWVRSFSGVLVVVVGWALFASPLSSLTDSLAVVEAREAGTDFARVRLFGSLGFVVSSFAFGRHLARGGAAWDVVPAAAGAALLVALSAHALVRPGPSAGASPPSLGEAARLLGSPPLALFLLSAMLHWAAFSPYNLFFAVHLSSLPGGSTWVGPSFALGVLAEAAAMAAFRRISGRLPFGPIFLAVYAASAARWLLAASLENGAAVGLLQAVHGLSFGVYYVASVGHVEALVPARLRATGRALFAAVVFGVGGIGGNALSGALFDAGGPRPAFAAGAGLELLAALALVPAAKLFAARRALRHAKALAAGPSARVCSARETPRLLFRPRPRPRPRPARLRLLVRTPRALGCSAG